ncbi:Aste57867_23133 [Aphanomyces stellatus]|uniref:protein O-GlcNAc transferase n=1 Tax=Aphanomyces stellatus TaxID=120398 RepID=A0A485LM24_9STRA|nr:hypothetical protein As57867_023062 [Aphanomyces stellatus]VFT99781.1 Aste57867_23133 [Aphanomyces stellatus]
MRASWWTCVAAVVCRCTLSAATTASELAAEHRHQLASLNAKGDMIGVERLCKLLIARNEDRLDGAPPSVYEYMGVAQYTLGRLQDATESFKEAVAWHPEHGDVYMSLGNVYLSQFLIPQAIHMFEIAILEKHLHDDASMLLKARNWVANWTDHEALQDMVHAATVAKLAKDNTSIAVAAADLGELPMATALQLSKRAVRSQPSAISICCAAAPIVAPSKTLKIGFLSSDFGIHPVAQLLRGLVSMLPSKELEHEVSCFALTNSQSWWRTNITGQVDYMVSLDGMNHFAAAQVIHARGIHVLVDLNGHTLHSGLPILSYRPAPLQISFLGYPLTTGSSFVDFFIVDSVSAPPMSAHAAFSEKMLYLPRNYIVNDHKQMMSHVLSSARPTRTQAHLHNVPASSLVFATFSNWQKMDPKIFSVWMHILQRVPQSVLWLMKYAGHTAARRNLEAEAARHGVPAERLVFTRMAPWINHTWVKQAADIVLDTSLKNGHTTLIDALWAGIPVVTLQGDRMANRAASSAVASMGPALRHVMVTHSFKEYEDVAVLLASSRRLRERVRAVVQDSRDSSVLFDTRGFTRFFDRSIFAAWEVQRMAWASLGHMNVLSPMHVVIPDDSTSPSSPPAIEQNIDDDDEPLLLHIGGMAPRSGWTLVNIQPLPHVDLVREMKDLHGVVANSVTAIYSSHALEHVGYGANAPDVTATLAEWFRVLKCGGALFLAVPDLRVLAKLFLASSLTTQERFHVMRMIYGGQTDAHDYHLVGFDYDILAQVLTQAGFCDVRRVTDFGLFDDTSRLVFKGRAISLNVVATACKKVGPCISVELPPN